MLVGKDAVDLQGGLGKSHLREAIYHCGCSGWPVSIHHFVRARRRCEPREHHKRGLIKYMNEYLFCAFIMADKTNSNVRVQSSPPPECSEDSFSSQLNGSPAVLTGAIIVSLSSLIGVFWSLKRMCRQIAAPCAGCTYVYFRQPALQTIPIFLGQASCWPLWKLDSFICHKVGREKPYLDIDKGDSGDQSTASSIWWWVSPAPLDFIACVLCNAALTMTYGGTGE